MTQIKRDDHRFKVLYQQILVSHSEQSEESPERTGSCFTPFSMTKRGCGHLVQSVSSVCLLNSPLNYQL